MAGFIHPGFRQNLESCPGDGSCWHWARWAHSQHGQGPPGAEVCRCCGRAAPPAGGSTQEATRREAHGLQQRWHGALGAIHPASGWVGGL